MESRIWSQTENVESQLHGVLEDTSVATLAAMEGKSIYTLSRGIKEYTGFKKAGGTGKTIPAYKAYLPVDDAGEAKFISCSFAADPTDIDVLRIDTLQDTGDIYDLTGRKVTTPKQGIYIVNSKKMLIK